MAYPPSTRYSTLLSFSNATNSLKSLDSIWMTFQPGTAQQFHGVQPFGNRLRQPVFGIAGLVFQGMPADDFLHASIVCPSAPLGAHGQGLRELPMFRHPLGKRRFPWECDAIGLQVGVVGLATLSSEPWKRTWAYSAGRLGVNRLPGSWSLSGPLPLAARPESVLAPSIRETGLRGCARRRGAGRY